MTISEVAMYYCPATSSGQARKNYLFGPDLPMTVAISCEPAIEYRMATGWKVIDRWYGRVTKGVLEVFVHWDLDKPAETA